jgi:hypothetical protein
LTKSAGNVDFPLSFTLTNSPQSLKYLITMQLQRELRLSGHECLKETLQEFVSDIGGTSELETPFCFVLNHWLWLCILFEKETRIALVIENTFMIVRCLCVAL